MKKRLAIVASHPIQYQAPVWRALAQMAELDVHVFFGSDFSVRGYHDAGFDVAVKWDVPLADGFAHTFLSTDLRIQGMQGFYGLRPTGLRDSLRQFKPDVVLLNACLPFFWVEALVVARSLGIPVLLRAEATDVALPQRVPKRWLRGLFYRAFYSQCATCLAIGQNARAHYLAKGVPSAKLGWSPYCVDTEMIQRELDAHLPQRPRLRGEMGFAENDTILVYSGKLIPKKDPLTLARALQGLDESSRRTMGLIVLGDGELRSNMEAECRRALGERAIFLGFVNQSQIGRYYAAADVLVLPSAWGETWGLVVNEALEFGLPAIVSQRVGCAPDLIVVGETGYVFSAGDATALKACLLKMASRLRENRAAVAEQCRKQVARYSVHAAAEGIRSAVMRCISDRDEVRK